MDKAQRPHGIDNAETPQSTIFNEQVRLMPTRAVNLGRLDTVGGGFIHVRF